jgi:uncharacterized membrane protein
MHPRLQAVVWISSLVLVCFLFAWSVWAFFHWNKSLRPTQPIFQTLIMLGVILSVTSGLLGIRDHQVAIPDTSVPIGQPGRYPDSDTGCVQQVWLHFLGSALIFGALLANLWRVTTIAGQPRAARYPGARP